MELVLVLKRTTPVSLQEIYWATITNMNKNKAVAARYQKDKTH
jgi:hypothetical protein